jgi:PPE-SVP subfamily C-terminal region
VFIAAILAFDTVTRPGIYGLAIARTFFSGGSYQLAANRTGIQDKESPKISQEDGGGGAAKAQSMAPQGIRGPVFAEAGRAAPIGGLSAPPAWASATPVASAVEEPQWLSDAGLEAVPASTGPTTGAAGAGPMVGMSPAAGPYARPSVNNVLRVAPRRFTMPRPALGG